MLDQRAHLNRNLRFRLRRKPLLVHIAPLFGDLWTIAMGAPNAVRPAHVADGGEAFGVVHQRLQVDHGTSIAYRCSPINERKPPTWADVIGDHSTPWNPY